MKKLTFIVAPGVALALPMAAQAAEPQANTGADLCEWRSVPGIGPLAPASVQERIWLPDNAEIASCACNIMKTSTADCMANMHGMRACPPIG